MTPCDPFQLSLFHDGELSAAESELLKLHLRDCADCRLALSQYRRLSAAFDLAEGPALSPTAMARISRDATSAERMRLVLNIARPFAAAAALILAVGVPMLLVSPDVSASPAHTAAPEAVWESALVGGSASRDSDPSHSSPQTQITEFIANDLATARR